MSRPRMRVPRAQYEALLDAEQQVKDARRALHAAEDRLREVQASFQGVEIVHYCDACKQEIHGNTQICPKGGICR